MQLQYSNWCILLQAYGELLIGSEHVRFLSKRPKIGHHTLESKARAAKLLEHLLKYCNWANCLQRHWRLWNYVNIHFSLSS